MSAFTDISRLFFLAEGEKIVYSYFKENKEQYIKERVVPQLYFCANEAAHAFELLEFKKYKHILHRVINVRKF